MLKNLIRLTVITYFVVRAALTPSLRYPLPAVINKITDANASCDSQTFNITVFMQQPFKGLLFAKDFSQECRSLGVLTNSLTIHLPTSGCGVRLSSETGKSKSEDIFYVTTLVVQQDRHLRQATDQEYVIKCKLQNNALVVRSTRMVEAFKSMLKHKGPKDSRTGRMRDTGWSKESDNSNQSEIGRELTDALTAARAWMEIIPEQENGHPGTIQVGEPTLLMVKSTLPTGIGWKVVDCTAHDGLGDSSQKLLDERGCPVDESILPAPLVGPSRPIAFMRHQEAVSRFSAFKFPDRDRLHLSCGLQLCRGVCQKVNCTNLEKDSTIDNRLGRTLSKGDQGEILDRFEVFNSVEVIAPGIELDELRNVNREKLSGDVTYPFGKLPGDKTVCVSPDKMAITFAVLGITFLCAIVVAVGALMKSRHAGNGLTYYSRSLFSSSSGGSGYGGSKLLLHESPCLGPSTSRNVPYGRVF